MRDDKARTRKNEAEWDAEIEAEFQRVTARAKAAGKRKRGAQHIGAPIEFWRTVGAITRSKADVVVALMIYRRVCICGCKTVTLPRGDLAELGVDRWQRSRSLARLARRGLIRIERSKQGTTPRVTLLWSG